MMLSRGRGRILKHRTGVMPGRHENRLIHGPEGRSQSHWQLHVDDSARKKHKLQVFVLALLPLAQQTPGSEVVIISGKV